MRALLLFLLCLCSTWIVVLAVLTVEFQTLVNMVVYPMVGVVLVVAGALVWDGGLGWWRRHRWMRARRLWRERAALRRFLGFETKATE